MTYKQVRDNFLQNLAENAYLTMSTVEEMELAISALEKQIPKKPILDTIFPSGIKWWRCPVCNKIIVGCIAAIPQKYCDDCGQALDWSDENDL